MIFYYQLYAKNINLFHFYHFADRYLENPVYASVLFSDLRVQTNINHCVGERFSYRAG